MAMSKMSDLPAKMTTSAPSDFERTPSTWMVSLSFFHFAFSSNISSLKRTSALLELHSDSSIYFLSSIPSLWLFIYKSQMMG